MQINIEMEEQDFEHLVFRTEAWAVRAEERRAAVVEGRFAHAVRSDDAQPGLHWRRAFWMGGDWTRVVLAKAFLRAEGHDFEVLWDMAVDDGSYVILTNYDRDAGWAFDLEQE